MEYTTLNNGVQMPMVGLGTWCLRGEEGTEAMLAALEEGYRLIDTARMYDNEEAVGRAVHRSGLARQEVFLTTKLFRPSAGYREAVRDIRLSLKALGTGYIDLLLIHEPYEAAPEMYRAMREARAAGAVRALGISNFSGEEYLRFLDVCGEAPAVDQVECHLYHPRLALKELLEARGTRMQAWAPFTQGRRALLDEPALAEVAARHGKTPAQAALRYLVEQGIAVIPKSARRARLRENLHIFDFSLTAGDRQLLAGLEGGGSLFGWD